MDERELEELKQRLKERGIEVVMKEAETPKDNQRGAQLKITEKVSVRRFNGEKGDSDGSNTD